MHAFNRKIICNEEKLKTFLEERNKYTDPALDEKNSVACIGCGKRVRENDGIPTKDSNICCPSCAQWLVILTFSKEPVR